MVIIHCYLFTDIRSWLLSSLLSRRHTIIVRIHLCFPQTYDHGNCPPLFVTDVGHAYCPSLFLIGMRLWSFSTLPRTHGEMVIVYPRFSQTYHQDHCPASFLTYSQGHCPVSFLTYSQGHCPASFLTYSQGHCPASFLTDISSGSYTVKVIVQPRFSQIRPRPGVESYIYIRNGKPFVTSRPDTGTCS